MIKIRLRSEGGPQVWVDDVDVTDRMTQLELLRDGKARVRLLERQFIQDDFEVVR